MKVVHVVSGDDGRSHFEDIRLKFREDGSGAEVSEPIPVRSAVFRRSTLDATNSIEEMHPARKRLLVVKLRGHNEIQAGDGDARVFGLSVIMVNCSTLLEA